MFKRLVITLFVLIILVMGVAYFQAGRLIKTGAETYGPDVMQTSVAVDSVNLSPFSGETTLKGFALGQPKGFGEGDMVALDQFYMKVRPETLVSDHIIIDKIILDKPFLDARMKGKLSNFEALAAQLNTGGQAETEASEILLTIHELHIVSPKMAVKTDGLVDLDQTIELASFTISELGTDEEGMRPGEIARHVMSVLEPQVTKALISVGLKDKVTSLAEKQLDKVLGDEGGLGDKAKGLIGGILGKKKKSDDDTDGQN